MFDGKKAFKGTDGNRALPFLHGGSLKITLTVPLKNSHIFQEKEKSLF